MNPEYGGHSASSMKKIFLIGITGKRDFTDESLGPNKSKRYRVVLVEVKDKCYWIFIVSLLFYLQTLTTLELDDADHSFVKTFDLALPLDTVDTVLNFICFLWTADDKFYFFLNYDLYFCGTIEVRKWYELLLLASLSYVYQILHSSYCIPPLSLQYHGLCNTSTWT